MKELSLHILDIVQNSINASATLVNLSIVENQADNVLILSIEDNGRGMDDEMIKKVKDPFFTTRTTRKVGLGIPLLIAAAERCDGRVDISSAAHKGTNITAWFKYNHIDLAPMGDIADTLSGLAVCNETVDFIYTHEFNGIIFKFSTIDVKKILDGVPINLPEVVEWIRGYIKEGIMSLYGGIDNEDNKRIGRD